MTYLKPIEEIVTRLPTRKKFLFLPPTEIGALQDIWCTQKYEGHIGDSGKIGDSRVFLSYRDGISLVI